MDDKDILKEQHPHWETTLTENEDLFGLEPSESAMRAAEAFKARGIREILELGGGQGRDTIFFAQNGFRVHVLDYTDAGVWAIEEKAMELGLAQAITVTKHDVREPLPFKDTVFEGCYSHMLYCMAFTGEELRSLSREVQRVLKPGGINMFTARTTKDSHYGSGIHRGENMYEVGGFIVHFFDQDLTERLSEGFRILDVSEFEEGALPRVLNMVTQEKE